MKISVEELGERDYGQCAVCSAWCRGEVARVSVELLTCAVVICYDCVTAQSAKTAGPAIRRIFERGGLDGVDVSVEVR